MIGLLFSNNRQQAVEKDSLLDLTSLANEAGYLLPVVVTDAVWQACVRVPESVTWEDEEERIGNILMDLRLALLRHTGGALVVGTPLRFYIAVEYDAEKYWHYCMQALVGPQSDGRLVLTLMFSGEEDSK